MNRYRIRKVDQLTFYAFVAVIYYLYRGVYSQIVKERTLIWNGNFYLIAKK